MNQEFIKNVSEIAGESERLVIQDMIKEREKEIKTLNNEITWLKNYQVGISG